MVSGLPEKSQRPFLTGRHPNTSPPTVTVDKDQPQHSVGIVARMTCGRVEVDEDAASGLIATYNLPQPAVFNTITDCPADHADAGVRDVKRTEYTRLFGTHRESVGYFRPNENVKFQVDNGSANPDCNGDSYLGDPSSWSRKFLPSVSAFGAATRA